MINENGYISRVMGKTQISVWKTQENRRPRDVTLLDYALNFKYGTSYVRDVYK